MRRNVFSSFRRLYTTATADIPTTTIVAQSSAEYPNIFFHNAPGDVTGALVPFEKKLKEALKQSTGTIAQASGKVSKKFVKRKLTQLEIDEINRLRHESLAYWTRRRLSKRFKVPLSVIDKVSVPIKYLKAVRAITLFSDWQLCAGQ